MPKRRRKQPESDNWLFFLAAAGAATGFLAWKFWPVVTEKVQRNEVVVLPPLIERKSAKPDFTSWFNLPG